MLDYLAPPQHKGRSLVLLQFDAPHFCVCASVGEASSFLSEEWRNRGWGGYRWERGRDGRKGERENGWYVK